MKTNQIHFISLYLIFIVLFTSCNVIPDNVKDVLEKSGQNRQQLEKVIEHYKSNGDKEKLNAAYFLIGNMANKYGRYGEFPKNYYSIFNKLHILFDKKAPEDSINIQIKTAWDSIEQKVGPITDKNLSAYYDYTVINADYLIENIDYAFKAWKEKPWAKHIDFDQFCEFLLPYRVYDEPLEFFRKRFYNEFSWLEDSVKDKSNPIEACLILNRYLARNFDFCSKLDRCPILGINSMYEMNGGICEHRYYLITMIMRSVGIPIALDFTPQRNNETGGHSWLSTIDKNGKSRFFNAGELNVSFPDTALYTPIGYGTATKTFRNTFQINFNEVNDEVPPADIPPFFNNMGIVDVTKEYGFPQSDLKFDLAIEPDENKYAYLGCFNNSFEIIAVAANKPFMGSVKFKNIGNNCIYIPVYYTNNQYIIANNPHFLLSNGDVQILNPKTEQGITVKLTRKYYVQQYVFKMNDYAKWMINAKLQAADNPEFKNAVTLFTIDSLYYHFVEKTIKSSKPFRYYRYLSYDTSRVRIAEVDFRLKEDNILNKASKYKIFGNAIADSVDSKFVFANAFDGNIATNFNASPGSWVAIDYGKPVDIEKVRFLVRNDLNVVDVGDEYELLYFDYGWKSLGKQIASTNYLVYNNVPQNALLLLRDLSKGREERIFIYKNGKQIFL